MSAALVATGVVTVCCGSHRASGCCDPEDCGPCCEECPTCPTVARWRLEEHERSGCLYGAGHDGRCLSDEDVAEERLKSRDYDAWAAL